MSETTYTELEREVIAEYEEVLLGNQRNVDKYYFAERTDTSASQLAVTLIKYVAETYWQWTPAKIFESISMELLKEWKLNTIVKFVNFPEELFRDHYLGYLAHMMYPDIIKITQKDIALSVYAKIGEGDIKKLPKGFFLGDNGPNRLCYCLKYAIENELTFTGVDQLYEYFGTAQCIQFLRECKLYTPLKNIFVAPVVPLHLILSEDQQDEFLMQYYRFHWYLQEAERLEKETRGKKPRKPQSKRKRKDDGYAQVDF